MLQWEIDVVTYIVTGTCFKLRYNHPDVLLQINVTSRQVNAAQNNLNNVEFVV